MENFKKELTDVEKHNKEMFEESMLQKKVWYDHGYKAGGLLWFFLGLLGGQLGWIIYITLK